MIILLAFIYVLIFTLYSTTVIFYFFIITGQSVSMIDLRMCHQRVLGRILGLLMLE